MRFFPASFALGCGLLAATAVVGAAELPLQQGEVEFVPGDREAQVPARFRLPPHRFAYQERLLSDAPEALSVSLVTFPSPVVTPYENNNTVHCEYYRPKRSGKGPAVIVLHILGGDFPLARLFCNAIALKGTGALFIKMPYYGPREQPGEPRRMISDDPRQTVEGMTQAILDVRRGAAWLAGREEVDAEQLGIFGISLGGITSALAASAEPRLQNVCLVLAGGDIGRVAWESRELRKVREKFEQQGGNREEFLQLMKEIDPVAYAPSARDRRILMLNATQDEVIPKECTESLWRALGEPPIVWYPGGHYSVARHVLGALDRVSTFFEPR